MARLLVILFVVAVAGVAVVVGINVVGDGTSALVPLARQVSDVTTSTAAVDPGDTRKQVFTVAPGDSAASIGEELQQRRLIRSALAFRLLVQEKGVGNSLAAGDYELTPSMSTEEIVQVLARGEVKRGIVATIPEGWRAVQVADRLDAVGFASREEFLQAIRDPKSVPGVELLAGVPPSLEGYLFPQTYEVKERVSGTRAAELMVRMFSDRLGSELPPSGNPSRLSMHEVITLASIVEREAKRATERPLIASVYLNRLKKGMPLQADPTVQYAVANQDLESARSYGYWKADLSLQDLAVESPYNTYLHTGLPPGPICNPGEASVLAVLQPVETGYLYFVAKADGSHLFANTLDEHNANVARVSR